MMASASPDGSGSPPSAADDSTPSAPPPPQGGESASTDRRSDFECNICLDSAHDAVISLCGHLFCWPCLHQWLETRPNRQICPVCKAAISKEKVVPLYGRGNADQTDPRDKAVPPRPRGQRTEPEAGRGGGGPFQAFGLGGGGGSGGFQMSFGIGAFPFGFFASNLNMGGSEGRPAAAQEGSQQFEEEQFLSKVFLWIAFAFIFWLMVA